jgi:hypothetical protein
VRLWLSAGMTALLLGCMHAEVSAQTPDCSLKALESAFNQFHQMPLFQGCTLDQVSEALKRLELRPVINTVNSPMPAGLIVEQTPNKGTPITYQTPLALNVSNGNANPTGTQPKKVATPQPHKVANPQPDAALPAQGTGNNPAPNPNPPAPTNVTDKAPAVEQSRTNQNCSDILVTGTGPSASVGVGKTVAFDFVTVCNGNVAATNVHLAGASTNLTGIKVDGACPVLPCNVPQLLPGNLLAIRVHASPIQSGAFSYTLTATIRGSRATKGNVSRALLQGTASQGPPSWVWWTAAGTVLLIALGVFSFFKIERLRKENRWREGFAATGDLQQITGSAGPIRFTAPPISIAATLRRGPDGSAGEIPITNEEVLP